jgi:thiol-disulfide isomerase/thioredoxin
MTVRDCDDKIETAAKLESTAACWRGVIGEDVCVVRRVAVPAVMVVVVCLLFWAGWHNLRSRRLAMQQAQQAQVTVQKDNAPDAMPDMAITKNLVGKSAPGFTLVDLSGKKVSLADFKGKPVVVNFWATYCGPCQEEMPWFEEFTKKYAAQNLVVLGLDLEDGVTKDVVAKAARKTGATYPILFADDKVGASYGVGDYLPVTVYVGKDGSVTEQTPGAPSKDQMEAHIRKIAGGV